MVDRRTMRKPPDVRVPPRSGFAVGPHFVAAVDAAKHTPAWVLGHSGQIQACGFDETPGTGRGMLLPSVDVCVLEASRSYGAKDAGKHGDIVAESIGGALTAGSMRASSVVLVHPDEWAAQTKKPSRHSFIWEVLSPRERELIATAAGMAAFELEQHIFKACEAIAYGRTVKYSHKVHNLLDAAGLYLFAVGRIKRGGGTRERYQSAPPPPVGLTIHGVRFAGLDSGRRTKKVKVQ